MGRLLESGHSGTIDGEDGAGRVRRNESGRPITAVAVPQTSPVTRPSQAWSCAQPIGVSVSGRPRALPDHPPATRPTAHAKPMIASADGRRSRRIHAALPDSNESGGPLDECERELGRGTVVERMGATDDDAHRSQHADAISAGEPQRHPREDPHEESVQGADDEPEDRRADAPRWFAGAPREVEHEPRRRAGRG